MLENKGLERFGAPALCGGLGLFNYFFLALDIATYRWVAYLHQFVVHCLTSTTALSTSFSLSESSAQ
jgi:hypothetical protein